MSGHGESPATGRHHAQEKGAIPHGDGLYQSRHAMPPQPEYNPAHAADSDPPHSPGHTAGIPAAYTPRPSSEALTVFSNAAAGAEHADHPRQGNGDRSGPITITNPVLAYEGLNRLFENTVQPADPAEHDILQFKTSVIGREESSAARRQHERTVADTAMQHRQFIDRNKAWPRLSAVVQLEHTSPDGHTIYIDVYPSNNTIARVFNRETDGTEHIYTYRPESTQNGGLRREHMYRKGEDVPDYIPLPGAALHDAIDFAAHAAWEIEELTSPQAPQLVGLAEVEWLERILREAVPVRYTFDDVHRAAKRQLTAWPEQQPSADDARMAAAKLQPLLNRYLEARNYEPGSVQDYQEQIQDDGTRLGIISGSRTSTVDASNQLYVTLIQITNLSSGEARRYFDPNTPQDRLPAGSSHIERQIVFEFHAGELIMTYGEEIVGHDNKKYDIHGYLETGRPFVRCDMQHVKLLRSILMTTAAPVGREA